MLNRLAPQRKHTQRDLHSALPHKALQRYLIMTVSLIIELDGEKLKLKASVLLFNPLFMIIPLISYNGLQITLHMPILRSETML